MKRKIIIAGIGMFVAVVAIASFFVFGRSYRVSPAKYEQILKEVMSVDFPYQNVVPDHSGLMLAYVHAAEQGRGLFVLDTKTLQKKQLPVTNEVAAINGWSPDGRYLAFVQHSPFLPKNEATGRILKEEWITLYDHVTGNIRRLTDSKEKIESRFVWLGTNSYLYVGRGMSMPYAEIFIGTLTNGAPAKVAAYQSVLDSLVSLGENVAAYTDNGEILLLDFTSATNNVTFKKAAPEAIAAIGQTTNNGKDLIEGDLIPILKGKQITEFGKLAGLTQLKWLRYNKQTDEFLFCAVPRNSNWRYLYSYRPKTEELVQLTTDDTYNGQYLERGDGFAYVGNTNFVFYLSVRPKDHTADTNLFIGGGIRSYAATVQGDKIYAVATPDIGPESIWEYSLSSQELRLIADGFNIPFTASRVIEPHEFKIKSFDGLEVPCFLYPPLPLVQQSNFGSKTTYPAVIYTPPWSAAAKRVFNARMQLLSNLGFYVLAVNYRGCEGYGANYTSLRNSAMAVEDVMAGREYLLKNCAVAPDRIFLSSDSDGSHVITEVLSTHPELWRAVSVESPAGLKWHQFDASKLPPIFFAIGDKDPMYPLMQKFEAWATSNKVSVSSVVYPNSGHITYKTSQRKDKLDKVAKFFISHL